MRGLSDALRRSKASWKVGDILFQKPLRQFSTVSLARGLEPEFRIAPPCYRTGALRLQPISSTCYLFFFTFDKKRFEFSRRLPRYSISHRKILFLADLSFFPKLSESWADCRGASSNANDNMKITKGCSHFIAPRNCFLLKTRWMMQRLEC